MWKTRGNRRRKLWKRRKRPLLRKRMWRLWKVFPCWLTVTACLRGSRRPCAASWEDGKLVSDAEYREALNSLKRRRLGGGRMA